MYVIDKLANLRVGVIIAVDRMSSLAYFAKAVVANHVGYVRNTTGWIERADPARG